MTRATTDPQDELFDVRNPDGTPAGYAKPRGAIHRDGDWHAALHIWVGGVGRDGVPFVIFQRRSQTKDTFPGCLDVAVGGHLRAGESLAEAAREAEEEIGLSVDLPRLTRIGRRFVAIRAGDVDDREVQEVYALRHDAPLTAYRMHPEEVSALAAVPLEQAIALFAGARDSVEAIEQPREGCATPVRLDRAAFVPARGDYAVAALTRLRALLAGASFEPFEIRVAG